jgi:ferredoxin
MEETVVHEIRYEGKRWRCEDGANLRRVMLEQGVSPYNGSAGYVNCRGMGTCGTCAVEIEGEVSPVTAVERWRLGFPPHRPGNKLRLACQCKVLGDVVVKKRPGFWGQL